MTNITSVVQITDLHIKRPGALAYNVVDTSAFLRRAIDHLNTMSPAPQAVVVTGDLVDGGGIEEYRQLRMLLDALSLPYFLLVGNHDARAPLREVFHDHPYLFEDPTFIQYVTDIGDVRLIALDSLDDGRSGGTLCATRLAWLERQLADSTDKPVIIALHHPPFATGIGHMDIALLDDVASKALAALVSRHSNVERIIAGHLHREIHARFGGTLVSTAGSTAHQVCLDLRNDAPSAFTMEPPTFVVHRWDPSVGLVSHLAYIDKYSDAYPFHDASGKLI